MESLSLSGPTVGGQRGRTPPREHGTLQVAFHITREEEITSKELKKWLEKDKIGPISHFEQQDKLQIGQIHIEKIKHETTSVLEEHMYAFLTQVVKTF